MMRAGDVRDHVHLFLFRYKINKIILSNSCSSLVQLTLIQDVKYHKQVTFYHCKQVTTASKQQTNFSVSSKTSMLLWLGLLSISMSLSYFFVRTFVDGVDSLDSSKLVAEPDDDDEYQFRKRDK